MTVPTASALLAEQVLRSFGIWRLPVIPVDIAAQEGIFLRPVTCGPGFDARIVGRERRFCIFYAKTGGWRTEGRVRFSLAHELGHYYLPAHRLQLLSGSAHNSDSDFGSVQPRELEADEFAADLLMPMELFRQKLDTFRSGFCTLDDLSTLAGRLGTSLTSTARRYCESDREPCTILFSVGGLMRWGRASQDMRMLGMYWCDNGNPPPANSKTAELWGQVGVGNAIERIEGRIRSHVWFARPRAAFLWEEAMVLGPGRVITQLTPDD